MPHRRTPGAPGAGDRAVGELDQVERVLDVGIDGVKRRQLSRVVLTRHAAVDDRQRLGAQVFRQQEVLVEAKAERLVVVRRRPVGELVVPAVDDQRALGGIADRRLPLIASVEESALDDAASGKAQEPRLHVLQQLNQVLPQPVLAALPRVLREHRHHVDVDGAGAVGSTRKRVRLPEVSVAVIVRAIACPAGRQAVNASSRPATGCVRPRTRRPARWGRRRGGAPAG